MKKKLFLIDGTALIYRAYYGLIRNPLYTSTGINTSAMFGTFNMFLSFLQRYNPEYMLISFDLKEKTFRSKLDPNYKINRPPTPPEMIEQFEPIRDFFVLAGVKEVSISGYEADDILGSVAEQYKSEFDVVIVTGDKDFAQIVDDNIVLFDPKKEIIINREKVIEKYGVTPEQFIEYLAICGDSADNIPGVKGIGPKGAEKLLQEFGDLDNIYQHLDDISSKSIRTKLIEHKEDAYLSRKLATIIRDLSLNIDLKDLKFTNARLSHTIDFLRKYELQSIINKVQPLEQDIFSMLDDEAADESDPFKAVLINENSEFDKLIDQIKKQSVIAIDTETTSKDPLLAELVGISLCWEENKAYYLPIGHQMAVNLDREIVQEKLQNALKGKILIAHNYKYDFLVLKSAGWQLDNQVFDTMIADYLLHPSDRHSLDHCAQKYFSYKMIPISDLIGKGKKQVTFDLVGTSQACRYSAEDAWVTWRLYQLHSTGIKESELDKLYYDLEIPLLFTLAEMESKGVYLDQKFLKKLSSQVQGTIGKLTKEIYEISEVQFNLNSTQQLGKILFDKLEIPPVKKTKSGYSTDQSVLEKLAPEHEIARLLLEYRMLNKLLNTYINALPALVNPLTGRIHSSFNQTIASTGRLSSSNPNLQNIPIRTKLGKEVRKAFCASHKGWSIVSADYSQIELRIFAILTRDDTLIKTFQADKDIHSKTASLIYKIAESEVTPEQRRYAKIINFGLLYGMGAYRISNELSISRKDAQKFIDDYFQNFPSVRNFIDVHLLEAAEKGYVETILRRKLSLPDLNSSNRQLREAAQRVAVNMPVQGSAADVIKIAMNRLHKFFENRPEIKMLIQVHDELVFEIRDDVMDEALEVIKNTMESAIPDEFKGIVPLKVEIGVGSNWFEAH
ncbi:MAG: DNA polymerase I [Candidatus Stygibacter australis]|nr:DNA polymerase I [Candidatus Stygibacter australis]MDP8323062.1 DNA polymerase I [Candidatus Stygibacter australis]